MYDAVCVRYGIDPAHFIDDDYLAMQLRVALFWANRPRDPDGPDEQERKLTAEMTGLVG